MAKWPFFLANVLLLGLAGFIFAKSQLPLGRWEILACVVCVIGGALFTITPFLREFQAASKLAETDSLTNVVSQVQSLDQIATQIKAATAQWTTVQEAADKTANAAREISGGMAAEVQSFNEFIQRANEGEKATLRLELDKLRRAENESLHVLVRILDHVYALNRAAANSRQPGLIEQLGHFQNACRDAARRIGLQPLVAAPAETFDAQRHQLLDGETAPAEGGIVGETIATGYSFQGKLLRPVLVRLQTNKSESGEAAEPAQPADTSGEQELPLETTGQS